MTRPLSNGHLNGAAPPSVGPGSGVAAAPTMPPDRPVDRHPTAALALPEDDLSVGGEEKEEDTMSTGPDHEQQPRFGWGSCSPDWLQLLLDKRMFLVVFVVTCVLQGMYYTYVVSVLTTIEKLFGFQSKTIGMVFSATELGQISGSLLLTYYGGQGHRPRWIGCGVVLFAGCVLVCSLPHFIYGQVLSDADARDAEAAQNSTVRLCGVLPGVDGSTEQTTWLPPTDTAWSTAGPLVSTATCVDQESRLSDHRRLQSVVLAVFFVALLGVGVGQTMAFNLGVPYMDDNISGKESPMYFAFVIGLRIFGPVLGFVLGSLCTSIYVYPGQEGGITTSDARWVGAWWLGMFIIAGLLLLNAVFMFGFPRQLPSQQYLQDDQPGDDAVDVPRPASLPPSPPPPPPPPPPASKNPSLRAFPRAVLSLLENDILMLRTASNVLHILPVSGLYTFLPKYLETQFRLTADAANIMSGLAGILIMFPGILFSGLFIRRFQPSGRFISGWIAVSALLYSAGMVILMFIGCTQQNIVGIPIFRQDLVSSGYNVSCSAHCRCPAEEFMPVCGDDGATYSSPCMAGCMELGSGPNNATEYGGCECVGTGTATAVDGFCHHTCDNMYWFIVIFVLFVLVHSTSEVGGILITLRCVQPHEKALAMGFIAVAVGFFGNVPCPILYGAVVDSACIQWRYKCGQRGSCQLYDTRLFRYYFFGITAGAMFAAFLVDCVVWFKSDRIVSSILQQQSPSAPLKPALPPSPPPSTDPFHTELTTLKLANHIHNHSELAPLTNHNSVIGSS